MAKKRKSQLNSVKSFEKEAERIIAQLAKYRDELRELMSKYTEILETVSDGVDDAENSLTNFEHAIDRMSEQI